MKIIKRYRFISVFLLAFFISGCAGWQKNYGQLRILPETRNEVTIQNLIDNWDNYNIYYSDQYDGFNPRAPLGIIFDPKNNDKTLVGDLWKKVEKKEDLIEMTKWIYPTTQYEPWLNEILGADGKFYGYLYYSYGSVILKELDERTMYVFNLEAPSEEGDGEPQS